MFSCLVVKQSRAPEHPTAAAAATLSSTRATLDSSSTRTPLIAVFVLLRTARAALARTSTSRFPSLCCTAKNVTRDHDHSIAQKRNERETNTSPAWPSSHEHTSTQQQQQQQHEAALEQRSIRAALVRLLLLFLYCCIAPERTSMSE